jgi:hypothetical protein
MLSRIRDGEGPVICAHPAYAILLAATEIGGAVIIALILLAAILPGQ